MVTSTGIISSFNNKFIYFLKVLMNYPPPQKCVMIIFKRSVQLKVDRRELLHVYYVLCISLTWNCNKKSWKLTYWRKPIVH